MAERLTTKELAAIRALRTDARERGASPGETRRMLDEIEALRSDLAATSARERELIEGYEARARADHEEIAEWQSRLAVALEARDAAVARGEALAEVLRRVARAMAAEADSDEACDLPIQARQWRDEVTAIESVLADPSPAAKRHMGAYVDAAVGVLTDGCVEEGDPRPRREAAEAELRAARDALLALDASR